MASVFAYLRLVKAGFVLAREGIFSIAPREDVPPPAKAALWVADLIARRGVDDVGKGERLTNALNRLGPSYIKLGQFLATRPDVVGPDIAQGLGNLRDNVPPFDDAIARKIILENLNRDVDTLYASFGKAVAAASIAQVHKAEIQSDGIAKSVAVKVMRPDVRVRFQRDLASFYAAAHLIERINPASRRLRPVAVVDTLARSVMMEMDLRLEASALSEMTEQLGCNIYLRTPETGGELQMWLREATATEKGIIREVEGLDIDVIEPPRLVLKPEEGDMIMMSTRLLHAVRPSEDSHRVSQGTFIGVYGENNPLTYWS